jgi:hypothetical protein
MSISSVFFLALVLGACRCGSGDSLEAGPPRDSVHWEYSKCEEPVPINDPLTGNSMGYVLCSDGSINRVGDETQNINVELSSCPMGDHAYLDKFCQQDSDCVDGSNGRCEYTSELYAQATCDCVYLCESDADCAAGHVCLPTSLADVSQKRPVCVRAGCERGDECASGECGILVAEDSCGKIYSWVGCRTESDECRARIHCHESSDIECFPHEVDGEWKCQWYGCD